MGLPLGADARLEVGLYRLETMQRLPLDGGGDTVRIPIAAVSSD